MLGGLKHALFLLITQRTPVTKGRCFLLIIFLFILLNIFFVSGIIFSYVSEYFWEVYTMSKKIIVAGLGHGGIAAAAMLADAGYDVTVYEKSAEGTLGYDWTDIFDPKALKIAKVPMPDEDKYEYKEDMTLFHPTAFQSFISTCLKKSLKLRWNVRISMNSLSETLLKKALKSFTNVKFRSRLCSVTELPVSALRRAISSLTLLLTLAV